MGNRWILVDGYSVLHGWMQFATRRARAHSLALRRSALVRLLGQYADQTGWRVTVVFDAYRAKQKPEWTEAASGVEVLFSGKDQTADAVIERLVGEAGRRGRIRVVSSDKMERQTVEALGAETMSAEAFEAEVAVALRELAGTVSHHGRRHSFGAVREQLEQ